MINTKNVVFITGAFVSNNCWDEWKEYFESHGYNTIAPPWPHKNATVEELRQRKPNDTDLATMEIEELIDYYANIVKSFPEKPIVVGHSFGGLITQIIVNRDLAAAGIAIHSAPPKGLIPYEFSFLKAGWKAFGLFTDLEETYLMSFEDFQYAFVNGMPLEEQQKAYNKLVIPESKTVTRGALTDAAGIDFDKPHAPLLLTSGSEDHLIPAHLNHRNYEKYHKDHSVIDYKEFEGRNHNVLGQETWKEDADYILDWIEAH